jgi:hypothetical protein
VKRLNVRSHASSLSRFHIDIQVRAWYIIIYTNAKQGDAVVMFLNAPKHALCAAIRGENYWLNGCLAYLMECLGESSEYDYGFFSGVTGDSFIQIYSRRPEEMKLCYSHSFTDQALKNASLACGYAFARCVPADEARRAACDARVRASIDAGVPVIASLDDQFGSFGVICGYDADGFYAVYGEEVAPTICNYREAIFVSGRNARPTLAEAYETALRNIPAWLNMPETERFSFGKKAFVDWADSFMTGAFAGYPDDAPVFFTHPAAEFSCWNMHGTYLCMLGTNACALDFLKKAQALGVMPSAVERLLPIYREQCIDGFGALIKMEGGFSLPPRTLKDPEKMRPISDEIRRLGGYCDAIVDALSADG